MPPLFILSETSAGYALFKSKDKKLLKRDDISLQTDTAQAVANLFRLTKFEKFDSAATALEEISSLVDGRVTPMLEGLLDVIKDEENVSLAVADPRLGHAIKQLPQLSINPVSDSATIDVQRAIRSHLSSLVPGLEENDISTMSLGLSHSMSRHKLKFSPDKVDTMIIQAIALLDDLDKQLNTYAMRVKEWYGWHFPEMGKIINDNLAYSRVILKVGYRSDAATTDLADILPEAIETAVKSAAELSMGSEINSDDLENIRALAEQVVEFTEYRQTLSSYLTSRMQAIAPNLTALVGELVGARLIAHAGSLITLAKSPASTIQILGAEKALFRALKTKHDTPKYGLLYHASLVGQATGKNKGKIARMLAGKVALGLRVDSLADWGIKGDGLEEEPTEEEKMRLGQMHRQKLERQLRNLEGKPLRANVAIGPAGQQQQLQPGKWDLKEARKYNVDADGLAEDAPAAVPAPVNGVSSSRGAMLIEEVSSATTNGTGVKRPRAADLDSDASESSDTENRANIPKTTLNGTASTKSRPGASSSDSSSSEDSEAEREARKAARKAEKAARKAAKEERRALKAQKKAKSEAKEKKKRKREKEDGADDRSDRKKKKNKH